MIPTPAIGTIIKDRYRIDSLIDETGECAVFKCMDTRLDVKCVVKLLLTDPQDPNYAWKRQTFIDAIRSHARLNHPNIVNVTNIEARDDMVFSVMELLTGFTLREFLETTELTHKEIVEIFLSVADAVNTAHSMQILHRNISPNTIFLNRLGNRLSPQILNFGLYRIPEKLNPTLDLPFLAPEQLAGFDQASLVSDIFGICATIYYAFLHRPPVQFDSLDAYKQYYENGGGTLDFPNSIPQDFVQLIRAGLSPNPADRLSSAADLLKSLKTIGATFNLSANLTIDATRTAGSNSVPSMQANRTGSISSTSSERRLNAGSGQLRLKHSTHSILQAAISAEVAAVPQQAAPPIRRPTYTSNPTIKAFADTILPPELAAIWKVLRIDSQQDLTCLCAVSRFDDPESISILKFLRSKEPHEIRVFNDSIQHTFILSRESNYFQNIVRDYAECAAFITDDIPRQSLPASIQANGVLQPAVAVQIGILIAQAMERAHQHGFVNGNLKPSNLFFETHGANVVPVIYDFGQKLYVDSAGRLQFSDIAFVDPAIDYNLTNTSVASDIYSFGMLLVYMLIGRIPFSSTTSEELISEIDMAQTIPNLMQFRTDLSPDLMQFIYWCTAFDPQSRYRNFTDVLRDLYIIYNQMMAAPAYS